MDRTLAVAPLITDKPSLTDGPRIFNELHQRLGRHNKVIFDVSKE